MNDTPGDEARCPGCLEDGLIERDPVTRRCYCCLLTDIARHRATALATLLTDDRHGPRAIH